ncbi:MAG: TIGR03621 family F420-dependent LLM class oxidoreductase [Streptosporangiaceae bacterium]
MSDGRTRPFRFSVQAFEAQSGPQWTSLARRAEDLGYSTLFTTDHYFGPGDISEASGHRPVDVAPLTAMTAAAMATSQLRVGCRVFCVDYHHPVVLAKELATLDMLSQGRVEAGLGAGWVSAEYEGLGIAMDRPGVRIERLAETVELLKAHWSGEPLAVKGAFVRASGFAGRPRPVQQPHPPIFIGGGAPRVLKLAGRLADIVSINFNNAAGKLGAGSVASSTREATAAKIGWIREGAGDRFGDIELEIAAYFIAISEDPAGAVAAMARRFGVPDDVLAQHPHALIGSVPEICDLLEERRGELGVSYINVAQRSMEAFAPVVARLAGR